MKQYDAEKLPAYETIKAALSTPSDAPDRLTPDRRTRILNYARVQAAYQPTFADRLARWFDYGFFPKTSTRYAVLRALLPAAITIFIVLGIGGMLLPSLSMSRKMVIVSSPSCRIVEPETVKLDAIKDLSREEALKYEFEKLEDLPQVVETVAPPAAAPASGPTLSAPSDTSDSSDQSDSSELALGKVLQPVIMKGLYSGRTKGKRSEALAKYSYGGGDKAGAKTRDEITVHLADETTLDDKRDKDSGLVGLEGDSEGGDRRASRYEALGRSSGVRAPPEESSAESAPAKPARPALNGPANGELAGASTAPSASILSTESTRSEKPLSTEPPSSSTFRAAGFNPFVESAQNAFSTFSIDVDTASYTLTRNFLMQDRLPPPEAVRTEEIVNYFDYHYPAPVNTPFAVHAECAPAPFGPGLQLLRIGVKARQLGREENKPAMLMFLIDSSGSMSTPDRFDLVKQSLRLLVDKLAPEDRVAIVQFDSHARLVLDYTRAADKARILQAIDALQTSGSTNLEEGMRLAYELARRAFRPGAANRVLLLSDGAANLGSASAESILATVADSRRQGIFCSVYGVGRGGYNDVMLETLANKGDGVYTFLDSLDEARRVFVDDLAATLNTVASDVKIQVEFNPARVRVWRQLGYENRALRKEDFRNDAVDAGEVGSGQSVTALYELSLVPHSKGPLGTVRVRCRDLRTGRIEEREAPLTEAMLRVRWSDADSSFKLAACAAELAEILRGSPFSGDSDPAELAALLRPVALDFSLDPRVQELLRLVEKTADLARGGK